MNEPFQDEPFDSKAEEESRKKQNLIEQLNYWCSELRDIVIDKREKDLEKFHRRNSEAIKRFSEDPLFQKLSQEQQNRYQDLVVNLDHLFDEYLEKQDKPTLKKNKQPNSFSHSGETRRLSFHQQPPNSEQTAASSTNEPFAPTQ
ncbi:MAG: hypothetical protein A3F18_06855 [Legionellales bacterium RIFCSPHIGHO2_12_FULL_37_14]|nr:MAG: hypothetical protein A3F18_06855 [Legionellales bacterium RIFCSPHIGHO2_12_FULL_37_14]